MVNYELLTLMHDRDRKQVDQVWKRPKISSVLSMDCNTACIYTHTCSLEYVKYGFGPKQKDSYVHPN